MDDIVGYLEEEGLSEAEIDDMLGPMDRYEGRPVADSIPAGSAGSEVHDVVRAVLMGLRDMRSPPGRQRVVGAGTAVPAGKAAKAIRVDTEASYAKFRGAAGDLPESGTLDDEDDSDADAMADLAAREGGHVTSVHDRSLVVGYWVGPTGDQCCLLCGRANSGSAICAACREKNARLLNATVLGFEGRGAASNIYGLFDRGSTKCVVGYTARQMELMGYTARQMELLGYTARQMELIGDVMSLESPTDRQTAEIGLAFHDLKDADHVSAWQSGTDVLSSVRLTGWDGAPRILTAAAPLGKSLGIVVGLAAHVSSKPGIVYEVAGALAPRAAAGELIPRICAASPGVLGLAKSHPAPFICAAHAGR